MLNSSRRRFFGLVAAAPLAAKAAAEDGALKLSSIATPGVGGDGNPRVLGAPTAAAPLKPDAYRRALANPLTREAMLDLIREEQWHVGAIDPDLSVMKSFSLNAKIAFQRQRNIERRLEQMQKSYTWDRMVDLVRQWL